ncbi:unnamed protein product, partial [Symbiodinium sp. KB8]
VVLRGGRLPAWAEEFREFVKYESLEEDDEWLVLGKPRKNKVRMDGNERPHEVCMVNGPAKEDCEEIKYDGTGITFESGAVIKAAKGMKCDVCHSTKHAQVSRPTTLPRLLDFNSCVGVDIFYAHDALDEKHAFLTIVDWATTYQAVIRLEREDGPTVQAGLARICDWHNIRVKDVAAQAKWQGGVTERQIGWFRGIWERVVKERDVTAEEVELAGTLVCAAKNDLRRRCGHSPTQWVLGRSPKIPEELCDVDAGGTVTWDLTEDSKPKEMNVYDEVYYIEQGDPTGSDQRWWLGNREVGEYLTMRGVKEEVNKLLEMDLDDPETYMDVDDVDEEDRAKVGTIGDDYR